MASNNVWTDAFRSDLSDHGLADSLLRNRIPLFRRGEAIRPLPQVAATAVMGVRLLEREAGGQLLIDIVDSSSSHAEEVVTLLLLADFVVREGHAQGALSRGLGVEELIRGDVLFVTERVSRAVNNMRTTSVVSQPMAQFWEFDDFRRWKASSHTRPRVFVANPGRVDSTLDPSGFDLLVIDGAHLLTRESLPKLLAGPASEIPVSLVLVPPLSIDQRRQVGLASHEWLWDSMASEQIAALVNRSNGASPCLETHIHVVSDSRIDGSLEEAYQGLAETTRFGEKRDATLIFKAWGVFNRLRQLAVPLAELEDYRRRSRFVVPLQAQLEYLESESGTPKGSHAWPVVLQALRHVYEELLKSEPAKLWGIAELLESELQTGEQIRLVFPTAGELHLGLAAMRTLLPELRSAVQGGRLEFSTARDEIKDAAAGMTWRSLVPGYRPSKSRYLGHTATGSTSMVAYGFEVKVEDSISRFLARRLDDLGADGYRCRVLRYLGYDVHCGEESEAHQCRVPRSVITFSDAEARRLETVEFPVDPIHHISDLADLFDLGSDAVRSPGDDESTLESEDGSVLVRFRSGRSRLFSKSQRVDVYFPQSDVLIRRDARELHEGDFAVLFPDDEYGALFARALERVHERRSSAERIALSVWQHAKKAALARVGQSSAELHSSLKRDGFKLDMSAVSSYYREGMDEVIAPRDYSDFAALARFSRVYEDEREIRITFRTIRRERVLRRKLGMALKSLLRTIVGGRDYETARAGADMLDTVVDEVASAIYLEEVVEVVA